MAGYYEHIPYSGPAPGTATSSTSGLSVPSGATTPYGDLASSVNTFMTGQALAPFLQNLPNYANMVGQRSENTLSNLKGQLPQDVINQISQGAAERGISTGSPGGSNSNSAFLRALGLNSLQLQNQGSQDLSAAIKDTPVPELWNPMSLYVPQTLAAQELAAAQAGLGAGRNSGGGGGGGGGGGVSGLGEQAGIPRTRNEGTIIGGNTGLSARNTGFGDQFPDSAYANWANQYGTNQYQNNNSDPWSVNFELPDSGSGSSPLWGGSNSFDTPDYTSQYGSDSFWGNVVNPSTDIFGGGNSGGYEDFGQGANSYLDDYNDFALGDFGDFSLGGGFGGGGLFD